MKKDICKHVSLDIDKGANPKEVTILQGPASIHFSWSKAKMADLPRLRCSVCMTQVNILGYIVKRVTDGPPAT